MKLTVPAMLNVARHPAWTLDVIGGSRGVPGFGNLAPYLSPEARKSGRGAAFIASELDPTLSWDDLAALRAQWPGKLVVKGILHAADARRAQALGADAIVLTNRRHQLDTAARVLLPRLFHERRHIPFQVPALGQEQRHDPDRFGPGARGLVNRIHQIGFHELEKSDSHLRLRTQPSDLRGNALGRQGPVRVPSPVGEQDD